MASGMPSSFWQSRATAGGVLLRQSEARIDGLRPLDEEVDGLVARKLSGRGQVAWGLAGRGLAPAS